MSRVLIIVDVANLYFCARNVLKGKIDFSRLYNYMRGGREVYKAIAYGSKRGDESNKFIDALHMIGFEVKFKEPKVWQNANGVINRKADWDVAMAMDAVKYAPKVDVVCFATADGDLAPCVDYIVSDLKVRVEIYGIEISKDLRTRSTFHCELGSEFLVEKENEHSQVSA